MSLVVCPSCGRHAFDHEEACPHCGQRGRPTLRALVAALGFVTVACSEPVMGVYGPAPIDPTARMPSSSASVSEPVASTSGATTAEVPSASSSAAPAPSAAPTSSSSSGPSSTATAPPLPTPKPPQPKVYGPPPRDPKQRN